MQSEARPAGGSSGRAAGPCRRPPADWPPEDVGSPPDTAERQPGRGGGVRGVKLAAGSPPDTADRQPGRGDGVRGVILAARGRRQSTGQFSPQLCEGVSVRARQRGGLCLWWTSASSVL